MTKKDKINAINESIRDVDRDILVVETKLENVEDMTNPAESQKQYNEIIEELQERKVILTEAKKDIEDLYTLRRILNTESHESEKQPKKEQSSKKKE